MKLHNKKVSKKKAYRLVKANMEAIRVANLLEKGPEYQGDLVCTYRHWRQIMQLVPLMAQSKDFQISISFKGMKLRVVDDQEYQKLLDKQNH